MGHYLTGHHGSPVSSYFLGTSGKTFVRVVNFSKFFFLIPSHLPGRDENGTLCIHIGCTMGEGFLAKIERGTPLTYVEFSVTKSLYTLPLLMHPPSFGLVWLYFKGWGWHLMEYPLKKMEKCKKGEDFFFFISLTGCLFPTPLNSALSNKGFPRGY